MIIKIAITNLKEVVRFCRLQEAVKKTVCPIALKSPLRRSKFKTSELSKGYLLSLELGSGKKGNHELVGTFRFGAELTDDYMSGDINDIHVYYRDGRIDNVFFFFNPCQSFLKLKDRVVEVVEV